MDQQEKPSNRNIPEPIKREVRQRCGFGCIVCGMPLYEYDHLVGWANVHDHVAEDITLLCDQHHREKTGGLLPEAAVVESNRNPHNLRTGVSKPYDLHFQGHQCQVLIGGNIFLMRDQGDGTLVMPIAVDETPLLAFFLLDGHLLLTLNLFDEFNNHLLAISDNQLEFTVDPWDITLVGRNLVVRQASRKIMIDIQFDVPNRIVINRARFLRNGVEILVRPGSLFLNNNHIDFRGNLIYNVNGGIIVGRYWQQQLGTILPFGSHDISRYPGDRTESEKWISQALVAPSSNNA